MTQEPNTAVGTIHPWLLMPSRAGQTWEEWEDGKLRDDLRWGCLEVWILAKRLRRSKAEVRLRLAEWAAAGSDRSIQTLARSALIKSPPPHPEHVDVAIVPGPIVDSSREAALAKGFEPQVASAAAGDRTRAQRSRRQAAPAGPALHSTRSGPSMRACASEASPEVLSHG